MSSNRFEFYTGDDPEIPVTLTKEINGTETAVSIGLSATVKAGLYTRDSTQLIAPKTLSNATTGSDWASGIVIVTFTSAETTDLDPQDAFIEIEVNDNSKRTTWQTPATVKVKQGYIA